MSLLGLDLSTRAAAAVAVPQDWDGDWRRVRSRVVGEALPRDASDARRARRNEMIATQLVAFARTHHVTRAYIESYAFGLVKSAHTLGELGGVVRLELLRNGVEIRTANMGAARKLLLGNVPRKDVKVVVVATLRAAGATFETADEADAFVAVNFGLSQLGGFFFGQVSE